MLQVLEAQVQVPDPQVQVRVQVLKTSYQVQPKYTEYRKLSSPPVGVYIPINILTLPTKKIPDIYFVETKSIQ